MSGVLSNLLQLPPLNAAIYGLTGLEDAMVNMDIDIEMHGPEDPPLITVTNVDEEYDPKNPWLPMTQVIYPRYEDTMQTYNPGLLSDRTSIQSLWSRPIPSVPHTADSGRRMVSSPHYVGSEVLSFKCKNQYGLPLLKFFENPDILINGRGWAPSSCPPLSSGLISMCPGYEFPTQEEAEPHQLVTYASVAGRVFWGLQSGRLQWEDSFAPDGSWWVYVGSPPDRVPLSKVWLMAFGCIDDKTNHWAPTFEIEN